MITRPDDLKYLADYDAAVESLDDDSPHIDDLAEIRNLFVSICEVMESVYLEHLGHADPMLAPQAVALKFMKGVRQLDPHPGAIKAAGYLTALANEVGRKTDPGKALLAIGMRLSNKSSVAQTIMAELGVS